MKRDSRLRPLSSEHHHALVLARKLAALPVRDPWDVEAAAAFGARFDAELEPHFQLEERVLLTALRAGGDDALARRVEDDHARLRELVRAARTGDTASARAFAERLRDHVRWEENVLFPRCEEVLSDAVLDEAAKGSRASS